MCVFAIAGELCGPAMAQGDVQRPVKPDSNAPVGNATETALAAGEEATALIAELMAINQPSLIAQQARVKFFRQMFAQSPVNIRANISVAVPVAVGVATSASVDLADAASGMEVPSAAAVNVELMDVEITHKVPTSVQQRAIQSLEAKVAARQPPHPLMPLATVAAAFHLISNGVAKIMIHNLEAGHLPVYGEGGAVIGTRDAITGDLTAGRESPKGKGQVWNNQG
jgi:hypothetical protein